MDGPSLDDELEDRLCLALYRAAHAMTSTYRTVLAPLDLTYPQYTVMSALWHNEPATVKSLSAVLGSDYSTMSPLLKRLESAGLLRRVRDDRDERKVIVHLTDRGRGLRRRADDVQGEIRRAVGLGDGAREQLVDDLRVLADHLRSAVGSHIG